MRAPGKRVAIWVGSSTTVLLVASTVLFRDQAWALYLAYHFKGIGVVVVDDSNPMRAGMTPVGDRVQCLTREGKVKWGWTGLSPGGEFCALQGLALDPERARIYVQDMARNKILALDSRGSEVFTIDHPNAIAVAVDPKIGEIWVIYDESYSKWGLKGETAVYDPSGARLAVHPWGGRSIVFNRFDDSFWVAGAEVFKVDRNGRKLTSGPDRPGWWWFSVAPHHRDGSVWVFGHLPPNDDRVVLHLDGEGKLLREVRFEGKRPTSVACDPMTGIAWVACPEESSVERIPVEGEPLRPLSFPAWDITFSERTGTAWLATADKIMAVSSTGEVLAEHAFGAIHSIVWIAAP